MQLLTPPAACRPRSTSRTLSGSVWLVPALALAGRIELVELADTVLMGARAKAGAGAKVASLLAGADSIDDLDLLRHGAIGTLFTGVRARRPRWAASCAASSSGMSASSTRSRPGPCASWPNERRTCCPPGRPRQAGRPARLHREQLSGIGARLSLPRPCQFSSAGAQSVAVSRAR